MHSCIIHLSREKYLLYPKIIFILDLFEIMITQDFKMSIASGNLFDWPIDSVWMQPISRCTKL